MQASRDELKRSAHDAGTQAAAARATKLGCEETLGGIGPALNQALGSVEAISKRDLAQLRSMHKPPKSIKIAMTILCIFLGVPPADKISKKTGRPKQSYWRAAQGKQVLGNVDLPSHLASKFDCNKITTETMLRVEEELMRPEYSYEQAATASRAASGIVRWIKCTRDRYYLSREATPARDAFAAAQKQFDERRELVEGKNQEIEQQDGALQGLKERQRSKDQAILEL